MENGQPEPMPKKTCMITLMFAIEADKEALDIKQHIDNAIAGIEKKRFTFQIIET